MNWDLEFDERQLGILILPSKRQMYDTCDIGGHGSCGIDTHRNIVARLKTCRDGLADVYC